MNLRNKPVDRRRLSKEDRAIYKPQNRQTAHARAKQRRGQWAWNEHSEKKTQTHKPGSGGLKLGRQAQGARIREENQKLARSKQLRNEGQVYNN